MTQTGHKPDRIPQRSTPCWPNWREVTPPLNLRFRG